MFEIAEGLGSSDADLVAVPEFAGPFGIADLVVMATCNERLQSRMRANVEPILHELDAAIVASLTPKRGTDLHDLAGQLMVYHKELERRVTHLTRVGAVERSRSGRVVRHEALLPLGTIFSIESKVSAWQRALDQARTYALWSDRSIAVLGNLPTNHTSAIEHAKSAGIGLALGSRWLVRPKANHHPPMRRLWISEMFVASLRQARA